MQAQDRHMIGPLLRLLSGGAILVGLVRLVRKEKGKARLLRLKETQTALQESEARLRLFIEHSPVALAMFDREMRYMSASRRWINDFFGGRSDLIGRFHYELLPDLPDRWREAHRQGLQDEVVTAEEDHYIRGDGTSQWLRWEVRPWHDMFGDVGGIIIFSEDITERKQSENALKRNEELLRKVLETLPVGVWIMNSNGIITQGNAAALEIWRGVRYVGMDQFGEYKGWRLDTGERIGAEEWAAARAITKGETIIGEEVEIECFDGSHKIILNSAVPIRDEKGELAGAIIVNQDITHRKRAEEELRQMLMQQGRLAVMGEMLGNIAHQWRQPLNVLGLLLQDLPLAYEQGTLTRESLDESVARGWELIAHMSQTIEDFRGFLSPEKTKASFSLRAIVEKGISLVGEGLKNVRVSVEVHEDVTVEGFQNEFAQVVMNILMNARDVFRERNIEEPRITVSIFGDNGKGVVTIADNAGGIPEEIRDRIFDAYFTTKPPEKGTGIGLFMSRNIIEKNMGGRLTVRNTGEGAEFRIEV